MQIEAMLTHVAQSYRAGGIDANKQLPENVVSDGNENECRHCLKFIEKGERMLILSHRPFTHIQAFAETGPVLLHAKECARYSNDFALPEIYQQRNMIVRGYTSEDRIMYGTGAVVAMAELSLTAATLFENIDVAYLHVRSASNNCYHFKVER